MGRIELVETKERLATVIDEVSRRPRVAIDVELNGFFSYRERICLIQLAVEGTAYLIDPIAIQDLGLLSDLLQDPSLEKVFHAADNDLRSFNREWSIVAHNVFDTSIAAAFIGSSSVGLQSVLEEYTGVKLEKKVKLQRSDWAKRPLHTEAIQYAADDVLYLLQARDVQLAHLEKLGRLEWVREELTLLENVRYRPPDEPFPFLSVKGSTKLDGRGLAVLRSLFEFRERTAKNRDVPPFKVMSNPALIEISSDPGVDLTKVTGLGRLGRMPASRHLKRAINEGLDASPVTLTKRSRTRDTGLLQERMRARARFQTLRTWRSKLGDELGMNVSLLWPRASLKRLAMNPRDLQAELMNPQIRRWQKREFGDALKGILATLH